LFVAISCDGEHHIRHKCRRSATLTSRSSEIPSLPR
jgi:hypothetical protein